MKLCIRPTELHVKPRSYSSWFTQTLGDLGIVAFQFWCVMWMDNFQYYSLYTSKLCMFLFPLKHWDFAVGENHLPIRAIWNEKELALIIFHLPRAIGQSLMSSPGWEKPQVESHNVAQWVSLTSISCEMIKALKRIVLWTSHMTISLNISMAPLRDAHA